MRPQCEINVLCLHSPELFQGSDKRLSMGCFHLRNGEQRVELLVLDGRGILCRKLG
jgi:hypothetical protein